MLTLPVTARLAVFKTEHAISVFCFLLDKNEKDREVSTHRNSV
jgi:hypothetical protein